VSLSFMIRYSTPSILTSVPDHLPNNTRSLIDVNRNELAILVASTRSDGDDFTFLRFFLSSVGDDAASTFLLGIDTGENDSIVQRSKFHRTSFLQVEKELTDEQSRRVLTSPRAGRGMMCFSWRSTGDSAKKAYVGA
jgi:hypothetical protein